MLPEQHDQCGMHVYLSQMEDTSASGLPVWLFMSVQNMGKLNFPEEEYNVADIKASASTFDDFVATVRREARRVVIKWWALQSWLHISSNISCTSAVAILQLPHATWAKQLQRHWLLALFVHCGHADSASHNATSHKLELRHRKIYYQHPYACYELCCWFVTSKCMSHMCACMCAHVCSNGWSEGSMQTAQSTASQW